MIFERFKMFIPYDFCCENKFFSENRSIRNLDNQKMHEGFEGYQELTVAFQEITISVRKIIN